MNDAARTPAHLWVIGGLAMLWNAFGCVDYVMTQTRNEAWLAQFTEEQRAYFWGAPAWMDAAWAVGVWGGLLGSLLLLARSRHAELAFGASLLGLLVSTIWQYAISSPPAGLRTAAMSLIMAAIWVIAIALFLYARRMRAKAVLR